MQRRDKAVRATFLCDSRIHEVRVLAPDRELLQVVRLLEDMWILLVREPVIKPTMYTAHGEMVAALYLVLPTASVASMTERLLKTL